jgi:hypothetical protein
MLGGSRDTAFLDYPPPPFEGAPGLILHPCPTIALRFSIQLGPMVHGLIRIACKVLLGALSSLYSHYNAASRHSSESVCAVPHSLLTDEASFPTLYTVYSLLTSTSLQISHQTQPWVTKTLCTSPSSLSRPSDTKVEIPQIQVAGHYTDMHAEMVENMKSVASEDQELSVEERNLLSVAYKNVIGARRASWRIVTSIEQKEESKGNSTQVTLIKEYRQKIEAELAKICEDILEVLDKHLIPSAKSGESKVFYHKMFVWMFPIYILRA